MRRCLDITVAIVGLMLSMPIIAFALFGVWLQDRRNPIYSSWRVGLGGVPFRFHKIRTMVVGAANSGRHTTSSDDPNVTVLGHWLRKTKVDELLQFWSIIVGHMSLVGPRPNTPTVTQLYTEQERRIFDTKPGLTDFSSIVFSDLDTIMAGASDVNAAYDTTIRPWKSRFALLYVEQAGILLDLKLVVLTALNFINRPLALRAVVAILKDLGAERDLIEVAARREPPKACTPPGARGANLTQMANH